MSEILRTRGGLTNDYINVIVMAPDGRIFCHKKYNPSRMYVGGKFETTMLRSLGYGTPDKRVMVTALFTSFGIDLSKIVHDVRFLFDFKASHKHVYTYILRIKQMIELMPTKTSILKALPYKHLVADAFENPWRYVDETKVALEIIEQTKSKDLIL